MTKSHAIRDTLNPHGLIAVPPAIALQDFGPDAPEFGIMRHAERALKTARTIHAFSGPELTEWVDRWNRRPGDPQLTQATVALLQSSGAVCFEYAYKAYNHFRGQAHCGHYTEAFAAAFPEAAG